MRGRLAGLSVQIHEKRAESCEHDRDHAEQIVFETMDWELPGRKGYWLRNRHLISKSVPLEEALTEERRKDFVKIVRTKAEEGKVAVRGVRRHARQELDGLEKEKENGISTDDIKRVETILDKMTQDEVAAIDSLLSHKEQELLEV